MYGASGPGDDDDGVGGGVVVCTGEVMGKVAGTDLLRRSSMGVLDDDKMIVRRTIHRSVDEAVVVGPCHGCGAGVSKAREDEDGEDGLRKGIQKRRGMKASAHGNVPDDSTSSKVTVCHYYCYFRWSLVARTDAAAVLYLHFAGQSTKPKTTMWTMSKTSMPWMLLGYGEMDEGNGIVKAMVDDGHEGSRDILLLLSAVAVLLVAGAANVGDVGEDSLKTGGSEPGAETYVSGEKQLVPPHQQMNMTLQYANPHAPVVLLVQNSPKPRTTMMDVNGEGTASSHCLLLFPHAHMFE